MKKSRVSLCVYPLYLFSGMYLYISFIYLSLLFSLSLSTSLYLSRFLSLFSLVWERERRCKFSTRNRTLSCSPFFHTLAHLRSFARSLSLSLFLSFSHSLDTRTSLLLLFVLSVRSFHFFASPSTADRMIVQSFCTCSTLRGRLAVQSYLRRDSTIFILLYSKKPAL